MQIITRTIHGGAIQTCAIQGIPYVALPNTTLNEKFNVSPNVTLGTHEYPKMQYWTIGAGGIELVAGVENKGVPTIGLYRGSVPGPVISRAPVAVSAASIPGKGTRVGCNSRAEQAGEEEKWNFRFHEYIWLTYDGGIYEVLALC